MEATCFSATSVEFQLFSRLYIAEQRTLHNRWRDNLKSYKNGDASETYIIISNLPLILL
jgi:hypothetical protein